MTKYVDSRLHGNNEKGGLLFAMRNRFLFLWIFTCVGMTILSVIATASLQDGKQFIAMFCHCEEREARRSNPENNTDSSNM
jgi:hypothetical protein